MIMVGIGASLGATIRYLLTMIFKRLKYNWPLATFVINLSGSLLLGILSRRFGGNQSALLFWGVGVLGGYTTFSTFNTELVSLLDKKRWLAFWLYLVLSYAGGIGAAVIGMMI